MKGTHGLNELIDRKTQQRNKNYIKLNGQLTTIV